MCAGLGLDLLLVLELDHLLLLVQPEIGSTTLLPLPPLRVAGLRGSSLTLVRASRFQVASDQAYRTSVQSRTRFTPAPSPFLRQPIRCCSLLAVFTQLPLHLPGLYSLSCFSLCVSVPLVLVPPDRNFSTCLLCCGVVQPWSDGVEFGLPLLQSSVILERTLIQAIVFLPHAVLHPSSQFILRRAWTHGRVSETIQITMVRLNDVIGRIRTFFSGSWNMSSSSLKSVRGSALSNILSMNSQASVLNEVATPGLWPDGFVGISIRRTRSCCARCCNCVPICPDHFPPVFRATIICEHVMDHNSEQMAGCLGCWRPSVG